MNEDEIRSLLVDGLGESDIEITVEGNRLMLRLTGDIFSGLPRVKRQQLVYGLLKDKISSGEIHAVTMTCLSRDEGQDTNIG